MRLHSTINFLLLCLPALTASAQQKFAEYESPLLKDQHSTVTLFRTGDSVLLADVKADTACTRFVLNSNGVPVSLYSQHFPAGAAGDLTSLFTVRSFERMGTAMRGNVTDECFFSRRRNELYLLETDNTASSFTITDTIKLDFGEKLVTVFEDSSSLYMLSYMQHSDVIYIRIKTPGKKLRGFEKRIDVNGGSDEKKRPHFSDFFTVKNKGGYFVFDNQQPYPAYLSEVKEKIYHFPGKLIFSLENYNMSANLVVLSLTDLSHQFYSVPPPLLNMPEEYTEERTTCSFLSGNIMFRTGSYERYFFMTASDIYSGTLYYKNIINLKDNSGVLKNPFFTTGIFDAKTNAVKNELQLYLEYPSIAVSDLGNNTFRLELSSFYKTANWAQVLFSIGASVAGTYAINSIPYTSGFSIFDFYSKRSVSVKNTLNLATGTFEPGLDSSASVNAWENKLSSAGSFVKSHSAGAAAALISGETVYVYFINRDEGKLYVYKF